MDHLPYPTHLKVPPVVVLYLGVYRYAGGDFATLDDRLKSKDIGPSVHYYVALAHA